MTSVVGLLLVWLVLWRDVTPGLVVTGIAVALVAGRMSPTPSDGTTSPRIRWWLLPRLVLDEAWGVARATIALLRMVATPGVTTRPAVLSFTLVDATARELSWVAIGMTLTPGTYVVDVAPEHHRLDLHMIDGRRAVEVADDLRLLHHDVRRVLGAGARATTVTWRPADVADASGPADPPRRSHDPTCLTGAPS